MSSVANTLTVGDSWRGKDSEDSLQPFLCLVLECSQLSAPAARFPLAGTSEVRIGRGERGARRSEGNLSIRVPDQWMSSKHVRIQESFGRWVAEDLGSKNGTALNGEATTRAVLRDGDFLTIGHTVFLFREAKAKPDGDDHLVEHGSGVPGLVTVCPEYETLAAQVERVANSEVRVLILGESGTGKEVLARAIHQRSQRKGRFIAVNCGALPANLVESELFGHRKGAFSGADSDRTGLVQAADGGTLFLDEIGDLPSSSQTALLRVLQEGEVTPVGATKPVKVDIRLLAATHRDIDAMVKRGQFRHDLYARVAGFRVTLPPLRQRREDIGMLAALFVNKNEGAGIEIGAFERLMAYPWPLNVRELESTLATAYVLAGGRPIAVENLPAGVRSGEANVGGASTSVAEHSVPALSVEDQKLRAQLIDKLRENRGNISAVARAMNKDRKQIQRWLKRFAIDAQQFK